MGLLNVSPSNGKTRGMRNLYLEYGSAHFEPQPIVPPQTDHAAMAGKRNARDACHFAFRAVLSAGRRALSKSRALRNARQEFPKASRSTQGGAICSLQRQCQWESKCAICPPCNSSLAYMERRSENVHRVFRCPRTVRVSWPNTNSTATIIPGPPRRTTENLCSPDRSPPAFWGGPRQPSKLLSRCTCQ